MIGRRIVLAAGLALPGAAEAQSPWKGYYARGTRQREVRFAADDGTMLAGTLLLPAWSELQRVPGLVLVAGSGPTDRNGNNPLVPARIDTLRLIAARLAEAGIGTLRYDKRGIGASTQMPAGSAEQERFCAWDRFVDDVRAAHTELVRHDEIKRYATGLLGHSEGGLLVLAAAPTISESKPHSLVLAATPGRPYGEILRRQLRRGAPNLVDGVERVLGAIRTNGRPPSGLPAELQPLFPAYIGPFLQGAMAFDPAPVLAASPLSCLLLHGGADQQIVPMDDIQPLIDALGTRSAGGEALVAAGVSHNLKTVTGPGDPGFTGPLAPPVADKLAAWLRAVLGA
ncbi:MAG: alpha/beta hydrolase family protein [Reyranella sp.]|uniref:alpha/beta hydrolase family protein n=1 Tax=Reyranella sp. TaxID=1929291 RepID=UPI003D0DABCA